MRVGFYESDITPPLGGFLWGHYAEVYANDVCYRLYAKAAVLENEGSIAAFLAVDCCTLPPEMHKIVTQRIYEYTGIPAECICISSNHTHTGAPVMDSPEIACYADATYKDVFFRLCADTVVLAYRRLGECDVKFGTSQAPGIAFCRNFELENGQHVTWSRPDIKRALDTPDEELPVIIFEVDGKPIGAITSFACHQCTFNGDHIGYSGDYASVLSECLKDKYGRHFVSLFLIGTCGDVNHWDPNPDVPKIYSTDIGVMLAQYFEHSIAAANPVEGNTVESIKEFMTVPRRSANPKDNREKLQYLTKQESLMRARNMMYYISKAEPTTTALAVQCIRMGDVLFVCLPGEVYTAFGKYIKANSPFKHTVVIENCNTYCGYIPTKEAFDPETDDLYETTLCYHSCHVPEAGDMITAKALEIAERIAKL